MDRIGSMSAALGEIERALGYIFSDRDLGIVALTHRSAVARSGSNNEKLEFLGDAVLDLAISDLLMARFPEMAEGDLSKLRAGLVNAAVLAAKAAEIDLGLRLRLGKGEERSGGRQKPSILAAAYEALLGAVYLDGGFEAARAVVGRHFERELSRPLKGELSDHKTRLQEMTQKLFRATPVYKLVRASGPDHDKAFVSEITIGGKLYGRGEGKSKKAAEQDAALRALELLDRELS
ncbi:MAG: ribonuclease III [Candidatus Binatia bacterium]